MISEASRNTIKLIAKESIQKGFTTQHALKTNNSDFPPDLQEIKSSFVTLNINNQLRGCIGHLQASQTLIQDIADNAFSAAFRDPRFPPLSANEFPDLQYHFSILNPPENFPVSSEHDLLSRIQPGVDGIVFHYQHHQSTFLPSVWSSLKTPEEFMHHLKLKAGLKGDFWHPDVRIERYTVEEF